MSKAWPMVPLGEVLTERREAPSVEAVAKGEIRIVAKIGFNDGKIQLRSGTETKTGMILVRPGDLLISGINAAKGAIAIYGEENTGPIASTIHYGAYIPNKDRVDVKYLWWLLRSKIFRDLLDSYMPGGIKTELKAKRLLPIPVPVPSLEEQRLIVIKIAELAAKIERARELQERAAWGTETLLSSEISHLFLKGREKGLTIGHLGDYVIDDCYGTSEKATDDISGTPILRMGNIQNGRLDLRGLKYLHLNAKDRTRLILEKGDILVNRTNSAELVGKCAVFDLEGEYAFASYLIRLRLDKKRAEPRLVALYINSPTGRAYMFTERKQMTGQANVNATKLKALPIALPSLEEQRRIVTYLNNLEAKVDRLRQLQTRTAVEIGALLPSVLDKAFKGEL
jgi:type I restriction enzyme S subunit